jgi:hypothetical protein
MSSERRNITQPADWWAAFEIQAKGEGLTLSEWMGECCRVYVEAGVNSGLSERPAANRPRTKDDEGR